MRRILHQLTLPGGLLLLVALTLYAYWPGLHGPFLFDDFANLQGLKDIGVSGQTDAFLRYIWGGEAGPLGRPLALLSFALQAPSWPSDPTSFKYVNILLHAITALLMVWLGFELARRAVRSDRTAAIVAIFVAAIWALHPINVSAVLHTVQRMNQLSTIFTLIGLIGFIKGRDRLIDAPRQAFLAMSLSICLMGAAAVLSKENGVLICAYALIIEYVIFRDHNYQSPHWFAWWRRLFLFLPLFLLVVYIALHWGSIMNSYQARPFTLYERLLSEGRILIRYLFRIFVPRSGGSGLFHDDFTTSVGWLTPPITLFAFSVLIGLLVVAWTLRNRKPIITLGIVWFFAGHLLESTVIPLELYFEHRNYLPMFGPLLAVGVTVGSTRAQGAHAGMAVGILLVALLTTITYQSTRTWSNVNLIAAVSVAEHPNSPRAREFAAMSAASSGDLQGAIVQLRKAHNIAPKDPTVALELLRLSCMTGHLEENQVLVTTTMLPQASYSAGTGDSIDKLLKLVKKNTCPPFGYKDVQILIAALLQNHRLAANARTQSNLYYLRALTYLEQRQFENAIMDLDRATNARPSIDVLMLKAGLLGSAGLVPQAIDTLDQANKLDESAAWPVRGIRKDDIRRARQVFIDFLKNAPS